MNKELLAWDIYEVEAVTTPLIGVQMRGRVRKFALHKGINLLIENAENKDNCVRFAILAGEEVGSIVEYICTFAPDASVTLEERSVCNPVLSKLTVNNQDKYELR